jgi:hypothetical protein
MGVMSVQLPTFVSERVILELRQLFVNEFTLKVEGNAEHVDEQALYNVRYKTYLLLPRFL